MKTISVNKTSSKGIVIGKAYVVKKRDLTPLTYQIKEHEIEKEIHRYEQALGQAIQQIEKLGINSDIFKAHLMMVQDEILKNAVTEKIHKHMNAEQALSEVIDELVAVFDNKDDEYMRERAADIKDVGHRILRLLKGVEDSQVADIKEEVIVVAEELTPSDMADLNFKYIKGLITELGGVTSHVSIIAKNNGLPALVGVAGIMQELKNDDWIIMDALAGKIIINPEEDVIKKYVKRKEEFMLIHEKLEESSHMPTITLDGKALELSANVGSIEEIKQAVLCNIDGIGLFRSESLYMGNTHFPTEEEQFEVYKKAAELCEGEVIIRTLDIGGDKELPYYKFNQENNPFLGWRGIRISLDLEDVFKAQLRAILRASYYGDLKIMFPMIISVEEFLRAKDILKQCKKELRKEKIRYNPKIETGIMVETPACVMNIEDFAKVADFFSIGTNDLTQYMLAVDRGNRKISNLYNSFHPAVLRSINKIIKVGHKYSKKVGMCGELASDPKAVRMLLGMGLDKFSMSALEIAEVKDIIKKSNFHEAKRLAEKVLEATTIKDVMDMILSE